MKEYICISTRQASVYLTHIKHSLLSFALHVKTFHFLSHHCTFDLHVALCIWINLHTYNYINVSAVNMCATVLIATTLYATFPKR